MSSAPESPARSALINLLGERSVRTGEFILASGKKSSVYVDARPTTMSAEGLALIGQLGLEVIRRAGWEAVSIGGMTMGADPVAYAIARASYDHPPAMDAFSVRKEPKGHGIQRQIEGNFVLGGGAHVIIVEDVITTGGSALKAIEAVRSAGGEVVGVLAVVDRQEGGRHRIEEAGIPVSALVTLDDLGVGQSGAARGDGRG